MVSSRVAGPLVGPPENAVRWLADENFDNDIVRGLRRRSALFDIVRVQDIKQISGQTDLAVLAWATTSSRILLTHDLATMIPAMKEQHRLESLCSPIVLVPDSLPIGLVIDEILLLDECSVESDWTVGVVYLPLR